MNNKEQSMQKSLELAKESLQEVSIESRLQQLGASYKVTEIGINFSAFGRMLTIDQNLNISLIPGSLKKLPDSLKVVILHCLKENFVCSRTDEFIAFREFSGGLFYEKPYKNRTIDILAQTFQNDTVALNEALKQIECSQLDQGDLSVKFILFGHLEMILTYWKGDEEFQPEATLVYSKNMKYKLSAEDVVVFSHIVIIDIISCLRQ